MAELAAEFTLSSARRLPRVPEGHPCGRVHGHTFGVRIVIVGPIDKHTGWVCDFHEITRVWQPIHDTLDHRLLNEVPGLENPTSERLAVWLWKALRDRLPGLQSVDVSETGGFVVTYRGQ